MLPPKHPSGSNAPNVDFPSPLTWKDQVTGYNVRVLDGQVRRVLIHTPKIPLTHWYQLKQLQSGYPAHRQLIPPPSVSERDTNTPSNPSPITSSLPLLAEEMAELRDGLKILVSRVEVLEAKQQVTTVELTTTREQLIESRAQVALLSSQAANRNEEVYRKFAKKLDDFQNAEIAAIRSAVTSSFGQVLRSYMHTRPNTLTTAPSLFDTDVSPPSTMSPQRLNTRRVSDRQAEPLSDAFLGSILTDPSGVLASNPVSPIASHNCINSIDPAMLTANDIASSSHLNGGDPSLP